MAMAMANQFSKLLLLRPIAETTTAVNGNGKSIQCYYYYCYQLLRLLQSMAMAMANQFSATTTAMTMANQFSKLLLLQPIAETTTAVNGDGKSIQCYY